MEILEEVGEENIFIFGKNVQEIESLMDNGYNPRSYYESDEELKAVLDWLSSDYFRPMTVIYWRIYPRVFLIGRSFLCFS